MKISIKTAAAWSIGALALILFNGCESTTSSKTLKEPVKIEVGMSASEIRSKLGDPIEEKQMELEGVTIDVWSYSFTQMSNVDMRYTGTQEVPLYDPFTGELRMVQEPVYAPEITEINESIDIFFHNGQVATWKQKKETIRDTVE